MAGRPASAAPGLGGNWSEGSETEEELYDEDGNPIVREPVETPQEKGRRLVAAPKARETVSVVDLSAAGSAGARPRIVASEEERSLHSARLATIRAKAGRCVWDLAEGIA